MTHSVRPPAHGWHEHAACHGIDNDGHDRFHPSISETTASESRTQHQAYEVARNFCRVCPVTVACLRAALAAEAPSGRYGIWGGLSPRQRAYLPRQPTSSQLVDAIRAALHHNAEEATA